MRASSRVSKTCQMYTLVSYKSNQMILLKTSLKLVFTSPINTEAQRVLHTKIKLSTCCIWTHSEDYREHMTSPLWAFSSVSKEAASFHISFSSLFIYFLQVLQRHLQYIHLTGIKWTSFTLCCHTALVYELHEQYNNRRDRIQTWQKYRKSLYRIAYIKVYVCSFTQEGRQKPQHTNNNMCCLRAITQHATQSLVDRHLKRNKMKKIYTRLAELCI